MSDDCVNDAVKRVLMNDYTPIALNTNWTSDICFIDPLTEKDETKRIRDYIFENAEDIEDLIESGKAKKEYQRLKWKQAYNKIQRDLVKHVKFSGDTCVIYWGDGQITKSRWDHSEKFDPEKAILAAMARKLFGNTNIYCEVLQKYADDGWDHYENYIYPNFIRGNDDWDDQ